MNCKKWSKPAGIFFLVIILFSCSKKSNVLNDVTLELVQDKLLTHTEILDVFATGYTQMSEKQIAVNLDSTVYAQYAKPTDRYQHGALGDYNEASQLVVYFNGNVFEYTLENTHVFEDIRPRLFDVDNDSVPEIITIRTLIGKGAGIAIYKITPDGVSEFANLPEIGTSYRWLNIAAIEDMDNDGFVEMLWVETPHIGGTLKVTKIKPGLLQPSDALTYYSNHGGGSHNMCLSVVTDEDDVKICYLPNQERNKIVGFSYSLGKLILQNEIELDVDFSQTLQSQYSFCNIISNSVNCIEP